MLSEKRKAKLARLNGNQKREQCYRYVVADAREAGIKLSEDELLRKASEMFMEVCA